MKSHKDIRYDILQKLYSAREKGLPGLYGGEVCSEDSGDTEVYALQAHYLAQRGLVSIVSSEQHLQQKVMPFSSITPEGMRLFEKKQAVDAVTLDDNSIADLRLLVMTAVDQTAAPENQKLNAKKAVESASSAAICGIVQELLRRGLDSVPDSPAWLLIYTEQPWD